MIVTADKLIVQVFCTLNTFWWVRNTIDIVLEKYSVSFELNTWVTSLTKSEKKIYRVKSLLIELGDNKNDNLYRSEYFPLDHILLKYCSIYKKFPLLWKKKQVPWTAIKRELTVHNYRFSLKLQVKKYLKFLFPSVSECVGWCVHMLIMQQFTLEVLKIDIQKRQNCRTVRTIRKDNGKQILKYVSQINRKINCRSWAVTTSRKTCTRSLSATTVYWFSKRNIWIWRHWIDI